ncbi:transporter substrate-binding domain-containing diguanylate cyclase [Anaerorhabdus sp.]|uniref:transporter substrate-binding domain-containing diguanylate cyclase n=1 Tax=Anaerorhabdus sp. TaxID=1872524 RepID=UPI002FC7E763
MKINRIRKPLLLLFICLIFVSLCNPLSAENTSFSKVERSTITVAILTEEGNNTDALNDDYITGYTHEYLTKLEQFSPVHFEFIYYNSVDAEILDVLNKVKEGEIDLIGGMLKNSGFDEGYLYSDFSYGHVSTSLLALSNNDDMNQRVLLKNEKTKIGIISTSLNQRKYLDEYCSKNKITPEIVEYATYKETKNALVDGEVDLIIGRDTTKSTTFKVVDNLVKTPYYFVSAESKTSVMEIINDAMSELNIIDPNFVDSLYQKYYSTPNLSTSLTMEEKQLVNELRVLRVGVIPNNYPLQYFDTSTNEYKGILIDIMNLISENTGLKIEYVEMDDLGSIKEDFEYGIIDMILGVPIKYSSGLKNGYLLTSSIVQLPIVRISNGFVSKSNVIAMSGYLNLNHTFEVNYEDKDLFNKVSSGVYKEAYIDGYRAQYYSSYYPNVNIIPSIYDNYDLAIGLYNKQDYRIMNILEQGISGISQHRINDIIYNNVLDKEKYTLIDYFKQNPMESIALVLLISFAIVGTLLVFLYKSNQMKKELHKERKKYECLAQYDQLTGVYNQQTFKEIVQSYIDKKSSGAIISMDLDNFKIINDTQGHFEGDRLLEEFGKLLNSCFSSFVSGRLGGDEFMVYLDSIRSEEEILKLCENFIKNLDTIEKEYKLTISIGVLIFDKVIDFDDLYYNVDGILYEVKECGRNNIKIKKLN